MPAWNFSLSDREFWPLLDKFLDAAELEPLNNASSEGLSIGRRPQGMLPRYGKAIYVGPFRLEVTRVSSHLGMRYGAIIARAWNSKSPGNLVSGRLFFAIREWSCN